MTFSNKMVLNWNGNYRFTAKNEAGLAINFDAPKFFGGEESALGPMENVLASLAACSSIHIISLLLEQEQKVSSYSVEIEGQRKDNPPRTFVGVHIKYIIKGKNIKEEIVSNAITDAQDNYWSVGTMLKKAVPITSSFEIINV